MRYLATSGRKSIRDAGILPDRDEILVQAYAGQKSCQLPQQQSKKTPFPTRSAAAEQINGAFNGDGVKKLPIFSIYGKIDGWNAVRYNAAPLTTANTDFTHRKEFTYGVFLEIRTPRGRWLR